LKTILSTFIQSEILGQAFWACYKT